MGPETPQSKNPHSSGFPMGQYPRFGPEAKNTVLQPGQKSATGYRQPHISHWKRAALSKLCSLCWSSWVLPITDPITVNIPKGWGKGWEGL